MALEPWAGAAERLAALGASVAGNDAVPLRLAAGRILAAPVAALWPVPSFDHAVMDGFALGALPPGRYRLRQGLPPGLAPDEAVAVAAGGPVPPGAAAVVLTARAERSGDELTVALPALRDNIRRVGEEAAAGDAVLAAGVRLDARHLALAAAAGAASLPVRRRPSVALLALHDGAEPLPQAMALSALLDAPALRFADAGAARGDALAHQLGRLAARHDLVVVAAESLDGEAGPLAEALRHAGAAPTLMRAALKPAKPVVAGRLGEAAIIGFAGTAYAVTIAAHLLLRPLLLRLAGSAPDDPFIPAEAGFERERDPIRAEALPVRALREDGTLRLRLAGRFGRLSALAAMDGFALAEPGDGPIGPGAALLYRPLAMPLL